MPHSYGDSLAAVGFFLGASMDELTRENTVKRRPSNARMRIGRYWSTGDVSTMRPFPQAHPGADRNALPTAYDAGVTPRAAPGPADPKRQRAPRNSPTSSGARTGARTGARNKVHDVAVIGGGPAGASCAYWLADAGWDVVVVEKKHFPRVKTCGDGLTPRAVRQLADMGLEGALAGAHRFTGLRTHAFGKVLDLPWPEHPTFPSYGYVITRHDLDALVNERAVKA